MICLQCGSEMKEFENFIDCPKCDNFHIKNNGKCMHCGEIISKKRLLCIKCRLKYQKTIFGENMKMIQLIAHISSLHPTETKEFCQACEAITNPRDTDFIGKSYYDIYEDIKINGIIHQLQVLYNGWIINGNIRYWVAIDLEIEYLPIDLQFFTGLHVAEYRLVSTFHGIWEMARQDIYSRKKVIV